ncbi:MAG: sulfatase-like hydrolase/transferase [Candidatus Nanopelagicales bacterium]|nr:sulfatase-like hydrolase/transferase [Candidatus Nanopelagicales bacterium]
MSDPSGPSRRDLLVGLGAATAAVGIAPALVQSAAQAAKPGPFTPRGRLRRRPNFLVIVVDEMRSAPVYESAALRAWRRDELPNIRSLGRRGMSFENHHIMSSACAPSRASFFTGQYPSLHGVTQTDGAAKTALDEDLFWLDPTTVPTMGHWFRAAGYETFYKGKWHVSHADLLQPGTQDPLPSYTGDGTPDPDLEQIYLEADRLDAFGFTGWIGPEPHGQSPLNMGTSGPRAAGRDKAFAQQGVAQIKRLRSSDKPWLLVTSFVNPHDITIWGNLTLASRNYYLAQQLEGSNVPKRLFDDRYTASANEDLAGKPSAQASYRQVYEDAFQPTENNQAYHRYYYQIQANVDAQIGKVLKAVRAAGRGFERDTIVVFLSDHGELLGAHGGLFQKWHQAYEEVLKVPFIIHNPALFPKARATDALTSHADLLPTMLGLAGADIAALRKRLKRTHTEVRTFPGRDLSPLLLGERKPGSYRAPAYFMTDDEPTRGANSYTVRGTMYRPVIQPCHLETVVAQLATGPDGALEQWKYSRYFDNPAFWSQPNVQDVQTFISGRDDQPGEKVATTTVKTQAVADQIEVYNLTKDPTELRNLASDPASAPTVNRLAGILRDERKAKRLAPRLRKRDPGIDAGIGV